MQLKNTVNISLQGKNIERFLNMCTHHNIKLFNIQIEERVCYADIYAKDFFSLKKIVRKSNVKIKIRYKQGPFIYISRLTKKSVFFIASFLCFFLLWVGSHFLWGIKIEGNYLLTNDLIIDYLKNQGIYYGMPLSKIPLQELKVKLRNTYNDITWVSIYLEGTNLCISLKENDTMVFETPSDKVSMDLVATGDGIVDAIIVRQGTPMVKIGDEVHKGDVLISSKIDILADDGTVKETRYCNANGEISLIYNYPIREKISLEYLTKEYTGKYIEKYDLYFDNKPIKIPHFNIPYIKYDYIIEDLQVSFFDIMSIPLQIKKSRYQEYYMVKKKYTNAEAEKLLKTNLEKIIITLEEKGVQIIEKNVKMNVNSAYLTMSGNLTVREEIE